MAAQDYKNHLTLALPPENLRSASSIFRMRWSTCGFSLTKALLLASGLNPAVPSMPRSADVIWNYIPFIVPNFAPGGRKIDAPQRQLCNAAQAFTFLDSRFNSFFPDRLAILANLCDYEYRINTEVLELPDSSFPSVVLHWQLSMGTCHCLGVIEKKRKGYRRKMADLPGSWAWQRIAAQMDLFIKRMIMTCSQVPTASLGDRSL